MKKAIVCATMLLALAGCGQPEPPGTPSAPKTGNPYGEINVFDVDVRGKKVTCVAWEVSRGGGISCDWANAK